MPTILLGFPKCCKIIVNNNNNINIVYLSWVINFVSINKADSWNACLPKPATKAHWSKTGNSQTDASAGQTNLC